MDEEIMPGAKPQSTYNGWLVSNSFMKRAFAVWGHYLVANLIVAAAILVLALIFTLIAGGAVSSIWKR